MPRALLLAFAALALASCYPAGASRGGGGAPPAAFGAPVGFEARTICESECRREDRCRGVPPPGTLECYQGCAAIPVRRPPIWDAGWAAAVAACIDRTTCRHDEDERCIQGAPQMSQVRALCSATGTRHCEVYDGLTPATQAAVSGCLRAGRGSACLPPFDWK